MVLSLANNCWQLPSLLTIKGSSHPSMLAFELWLPDQLHASVVHISRSRCSALLGAVELTCELLQFFEGNQSYVQMWGRDKERNLTMICAPKGFRKKMRCWVYPLEDTQGKSAHETDVRITFIKGRVCAYELGLLSSVALILPVSTAMCLRVWLDGMLLKGSGFDSCHDHSCSP